MHQPFGPAEGLYLVHQAMVKGEMQRNNPELHLYVRDHGRSRVFATMRRATGAALIAIGIRIAPDHRTVSHAGDTALAGQARG